MSLKFAKRVAAEMLNRGESSIRINPNAIEDVKKALTREDVRKLVKEGSVFALKAKHNVSMNSKVLKKKRSEGRRRGIGRRRGSRKARGGISWEKKVRGQRAMLKELKRMGKLDSASFNRFYMLVKGNSFHDKSSLLLHLKDEGISISDEDKKNIDAVMKKRYER
ncbi:MAG: 50S ribosomal protein L19e [Candidatus Micrarchaeia archaeon]